MSVVSRYDFGGEPIPGGARFDRQIGRALLELYSSVVMVVSRELEILACRGDLTPVLGPAGADTPASRLTSASNGVGAAIRRLVGSAARIGAWQTEAVPLQDSSEGAAGGHLRVTAFPVADLPDGPLFVIVIDSVEPPAQASIRIAAAGESESDRVRELEAELAEARCCLHDVTEDYEGTTEELRCAHEELQAANEELLKANEELEGSQILLEAVNRDLRQSNRELMRANRDLVGLLDGISLPVVMLDDNLRVRRFNPSSRKLFNLVPSDVGRPISDLRSKLPIPGLDAACREVLGDLAPRQVEVRGGPGRGSVLSIRPYRAAGNLIEGVVLTLTPPQNVLELSAAG